MNEREALTAEQVQEIIDSIPDLAGRIALSYEHGSTATSRGISNPTHVCMAFVRAIDAAIAAQAAGKEGA